MSKNLEKDQKPQEFNPYENDKLSKVPSWLKILFLKYWVAAAALFFFIIGNPLIQSNIGDGVDGSLFEVYLIITVLGLGLFQEYIIKPIVRLMRNSRDNTYYYNMVNLKGVLSFFANLGYAFLIAFPMYIILTFMASKGWVIDLFHSEGGAGAIEPITGGFVYVAIDFIYVFIKNVIIRIINEVKFKKEDAKAKELEAQLINEEKYGINKEL